MNKGRYEGNWKTAIRRYRVLQTLFSNPKAFRSTFSIFLPKICVHLTQVLSYFPKSWPFSAGWLLLWKTSLSRYVCWECCPKETKYSTPPKEIQKSFSSCANVCCQETERNKHGTCTTYAQNNYFDWLVLGPPFLEI